LQSYSSTAGARRYANVVIGYLGGKPANLVAHFEREILQTTFHLPIIAFFELRYGIAKSARVRENTERLALFLQLPITILPFEPEDAEEAGDIRAQLERAGTPIGP
jgi:tRNA(fMet)-specific endonuclease VapC